jgi:Ca-activated chloride channel homolog
VSFLPILVPVSQRPFLKLLLLILLEVLGIGKGSSAPLSQESVPPQADREDSSFSLKVNVDLVVLSVTVEDEQGKNITHLKKEDFSVYEDNTLQSIGEFLPVEAPFNLALILDTSGSARDSLGLIKKAAIEFTRQLRPVDRVAVAAFASSVRQVQDLTNDRGKLKQVIESLTISNFGGSKVYDAIAQSVYRLRGQTGGRNAIVILSDGLENSSRIKFDGLRLLLAQSDAVLYPITILSRHRQQYQLEQYIRTHGEDDVYAANARASLAALAEIYQIQTDRILALAQETGGKVFVVSTLTDLTGEYSKIAQELRNTYSLAYYSANDKRDGTLRKVRVEVKGPKLVARTRSNYFVPKEE